MRRVKAFIISTLILWGLWLVLGGTHYQEVFTGLVVAILISAIFISKLSLLEDIRLSPAALWHGLLFILVFIREMIFSAFDVAGRVLSPGLPINPGIVKVRTALKSPLGRIVLANAITLTPGTMTVETSGEYLYIHWIDIKSEDVDAATASIVSVFERHLEVVFG